MNDEALLAALDRAERALDRIERVRTSTDSLRDDRFRAQVRDVIADLDTMISEAESR